MKRLAYRWIVIAGFMVAALVPAGAQMAPARPNQVRSQLAPAVAVAPSPAPRAAQAPAPASGPAAARPASRRDPFDPLIGKSTGGSGAAPALPPGKAGLTIGTLRIMGLVRGPDAMIAVVSNPQQRVYFLREGDRIFDGSVIRITMEAVTFQQAGRDPFGAPFQREVVRRLYPVPGGQ
jgi:hypothetical protein